MTTAISEVERLRSQVAALEQLLAVYENAAVEQAERLELSLEELQRLRSELELQVQNRTAELTRAVADLQAEVAERAKAEETLRESEGRFRSVAETATDAIVCSDGSGAIVFWNSSAERIFGFQSAEILGRPLTTIIPERFRDAHQSRWTAMRDFRSSSIIGRTVEVVGRRSDGNEFPAELSVGAFMTRQGPYFAGIVRDITERKRSEMFRDEYLSLVAHDLRNPLATIMGRTSSLGEMLAAEGLHAHSLSASIILKNARRISSLLEDLVESVRLESDRLVLHKKTTNLEGLVRDVAARVSTLADRERISVRVKEPIPATVADPERIERAVVNLLTNALKFSNAGTPVTVSIGRGPGEAIISVADQGVGILPENLPRLFQRFRTVQGSENTASLGLGLYITRLIVEAHGGRVWVESTPGAGSTFRFTLPLSGS